MNFIKNKISGVQLIQHLEFIDYRGMNKVIFERLDKQTKLKFNIEQSLVTVSKQNVIRGLHYSKSPHNQHMLVTCMAGNLTDYCVDIRIGSPTFGNVTITNLSTKSRVSLFFPSGVAHGYEIKSDDTAVLYHLSKKYQPSQEFTLNPFDSRIGIEWETKTPILSFKDKTAENLIGLMKKNLLPHYSIDSLCSD